MLCYTSCELQLSFIVTEYIAHITSSSTLQLRIKLYYLLRPYTTSQSNSSSQTPHETTTTTTMSLTFALFRRQALRAPFARPIQTIRPFSSTMTFAARKDAQGKDDLKPEPNEYSKSGSDDAAARVEETAFSPDKTSPEEQHAHAEGESSEVSSRTILIRHTFYIPVHCDAGLHLLHCFINSQKESPPTTNRRDRARTHWMSAPRIRMLARRLLEPRAVVDPMVARDKRVRVIRTVRGAAVVVALRRVVVVRSTARRSCLLDGIRFENEDPGRMRWGTRGFSVAFTLVSST